MSLIDEASSLCALSAQRGGVVFSIEVNELGINPQVAVDRGWLDPVGIGSFASPKIAEPSLSANVHYRTALLDREIESFQHFESVATLDAELGTHVRDAAILTLLAGLRGFSRDNAAIGWRCQAVRDQKRIAADLLYLAVVKIWRISGEHLLYERRIRGISIEEKRLFHSAIAYPRV